ncbi:PAC2 family protein [Chitinispirillales bacterium ANBcel5]|uniref:proteasome assembly chaperone family protein n=1 Tax=Cellulosispirillum alkaliphilum TaxID=3039283 RepID=UPI002A4EE30C|nr:PAC2 family protein [Chitinispirillales bacterium ANBcel5]
MGKGMLDFNTPPLMFAAWPGMGDVGLTAMEYIRRGVDARLFAELDMGPFYSPEEVVVHKGLASFPEIPKSFFMEQHNPDLVFFESTMQLGGTEAITVAEAVLDVARKIKAPRIFTAAAFPYPMSYKAPSRVFAAANRQKFLRELSLFGIEPMPEGFISGLNGVLLGIAASQDIEAACILATIPSYASGLLYPKGSLEIIKALSKIADLDVDTSEIEEQTRAYDETYEDIEERLRQVFPSMIEGDEELGLEQPFELKEQQGDDERVPEMVMNRIERLFREVAQSKNRERAKELKAELDRWGIFDLYEKRFLDLFKEEE